MVVTDEMAAAAYNRFVNAINGLCPIRAACPKTPKVAQKGGRSILAALGLFVVIAVVLAMGQEGYAAFEAAPYYQPPFNKYPVTKFQNVCPTSRENVAIANPSPQKLLPFAIHVSEHMPGANIDGADGLAFGAQDKRLLNPLLVRLAELEIDWILNVLRNEEDINGGRWSGARILNPCKDAQPRNETVVNEKFVLWNNENMGALRSSTVVDLSPSDGRQNERGQEQEKGEASHGIVAHFLKVFFEAIPPWAVTAIIGALCGTIGFTIYLDFFGWRAAFGFCLMGLGLLTPIFPWWVFLLLPFEGK